MAARRTQVGSAGGTLLAVYAGLLLAASLAFPWWRMENRAPQYGMRVLWVDVSPLSVEGDVKEIDCLGHYVGMRPIGDLARAERAAAPWLLAVSILCALALPFLRPGWGRLLAALVVVAVPIGFALDLWFWQQWAVTHLDPQAALNKIADRVQARLVGRYQVAQFKVDASFQEGFWLAVVAAANALGFLFAERRRRASAAPAGAPAAARPVLAGAAALVLLAPAAGAATLEVGAGARFTTIGAAVAAAAPGDTVLVRAGVWRERVRVDRPLVLETREGAVLDGGGAGTVVLVTRGPSTVRGFAVRGSGDSLLEEDAGVKLLGAPDSAVEDCRVEDALFGIMARSSPRARIAKNRVTGKALPIPRQGDGIRLQDASGSSIEDNVVERSRDLAIWHSNGCVARRNEVSGSRYGLHYMYCDDNVFEDNVFTGNQTGGAIMYSRRLELRRNRFAGSRGPSAYGLLIKVADDVLAERNWFTDNTRGVFLEDAPSSLRASCTIRENVIGGNDVGVALQPSVSRVAFLANAFLANRVQVETLGQARGETNVWSRDGRGNYWSDYAGFDADGDGVGDTPYRLDRFFEDLAGRWPAVGLLRLGPATQALETAARAFPVVKPRPALTDAHPLIRMPGVLGAPPARGARPLLSAAGLAAAALAALALLRARVLPGGVS
jgi:nitrous oxidase accessory protein